VWLKGLFKDLQESRIKNQVCATEHRITRFEQLLLDHSSWLAVEFAVNVEQHMHARSQRESVSRLQSPIKRLLFQTQCSFVLKQYQVKLLGGSIKASPPHPVVRSVTLVMPVMRNPYWSLGDVEKSPRTPSLWIILKGARKHLSPNCRTSGGWCHVWESMLNDFGQSFCRLPWCNSKKK
jgi:hypothetical protein